MMKSLLKVSLAMMLAIFLVTSCIEDKDEADNQKEEPITKAEMQNNANPYDEQGVMYNGFLHAIATEGQGIGGWDVSKLADFRKGIGGWDVSKLALSNGDKGGWDVSKIAISSGDKGGWDVSKLVSFAMGFTGDNGKDNSDLAQRRLSTQLKVFSDLKVISPVLECQLYPERCKYFTNSVIHMLDASNGGTAHDRTLKYINAVRDLEAKILIDDKMNNAEKDGFLVSYSIARYAAGYWYNESRISDEPIDKITLNMIRLSALAASTAHVSTDSKEVGVGAAILSTYIATGRAN